jgi:hypothetical protein
MTDDAEWDRDPATRAGLDARLQDMLLQHTACDLRWARTVMGLAGDLVASDSVPEMLTSVCVLIDNLAVWAYGGRQEAIDRFTADLAQLRAIAAKGAAP